MGNDDFPIPSVHISFVESFDRSSQRFRPLSDRAKREVRDWVVDVLIFVVFLRRMHYPFAARKK